MMKRRCGLLALLAIFAAFFTVPAMAACTSPPGADSATRYDHALHKMFICDDTNWIAIPGGPNSGFGCTLDGVVVPDGASFDFYSAPSHANCNSIKLSRACANGTLGGSASYQYASCTNADTTPDAFSFNDVTNAPDTTLTYPSPASITISGISASTPVSVSGQGSPQIRINGGSWVTSGTITNGQSLEVRLTSGDVGTTRNATIDVGGVTDIWSVTAVVTDTTPDAFSFGDVTGSSTGEWISNGGADPTILGINAPTPVSISGQGTPQIRVVGVGSWVTSTTVTNGQRLATRLLTATTGGTTYTATINVGGVTDNWSVTTGCSSGGVIVANICWYYGGTSQSCNTVCSSRGGYNAATLSYAGSGGTNLQCRNVLDALGVGTNGAVPSAIANTYGCYYGSDMMTRSRGTSATSATVQDGTKRRACACNN